MNQKITLQLSHDSIRILAEITEWLIGMTDEDNLDALLRQSILIPLLKDKLEKYRWERAPKYAVRFTLTQALAWYNEVFGHDTSRLDAYSQTVIGEVMRIFDLQIRNRKAQLISEHRYQPQLLETIPPVLQLAEEEE